MNELESVYAKMDKEDEALYREHPEYLPIWWLQQGMKEGTLPRPVPPEDLIVFPPWYRRDLAPYTGEDEFGHYDDSNDDESNDEEELKDNQLPS